MNNFLKTSENREMDGSNLSKILLCVTLLLKCNSLIAAQINLLQPANIESKSYGVCHSENALQQLHSEVDEVLNSRVVPQLYGLYRDFPADSCADIYQGHPSGLYWLNVSHGPQQLYCSVNENRCCNESDGKWTRIAYLNMSDPSAQCPQDWREVVSPIRTCRRQFQTSINSVNYSSYGIPYSKVCGRIIAYQFGTPEAFFGFNGLNQITIDDAYVDGISITYGHPRNHVWTFAAARGTINIAWHCPCYYNEEFTTPSFINNDFFCDSGSNDTSEHTEFIDNNPLWDGHGCTGSSTCCEFNNPPWFCKQLPEPTTEDIEIRIMGSVNSRNSLEEEDTPVQLIEIYVQ